ncbi:hypothetical protein [Luteolibacter soli]|uniref:DUF1376 domain-containing protein n=1 Tax=Luteolibacter soli TaxID=3135280 RepID=A0ABU9AY25_9BACT
MEFLNLHSSALDSPEMAGADPAELGTWLMLARYCAGQENGGVIAGCREWRDRKWQAVARVAQGMVMREAELWTWDGDDLHVKHYPAEQEAAVKAKRERNRCAGQVKTETKAEAARVNGARGGRPRSRGVGGGEVGAGALLDLTDAGGGPGDGSDIPTGNPTGFFVGVDDIRTEGKGREENEREVLEECESAREGARGRSFVVGSGSRDGERFGDRDRELEISRQAETIVRSYPRQERFAEALMMVRGHLAAGESFPVMLAGTKAAAEALAKAPSGAANKYAPSALKFFEGKRWMDDPGTLIRPAVVSGGSRQDRGEMSAEEVAMQLGGRVG